MIYNRKKDKDRVILKVDYGVDYSKNYYDRVDSENKMAAYIQKELRNWWKKHNNERPFILIVEAGNVVDRAPFFPFKIELTQLNQTEEEQENFKTLCAEKTREIIEEYLRK
ncbi:MAG: hypothetical protein II453_14380 [Alphaproteobacteria bacterium]|nr:hypothetical protein [Alphaproteobacteria bacterium]